jgi:hypothetical protein
MNTQKADNILSMQRYGSIFYDMDVTVTRLSCLALLDNSNPHAVDQIEEMTDDLDFSEYAALFGFDEAELEADDMAISNELVIEFRRGWLVSALAMLPQNISFMEDGSVSGYSSSATFRPLLVYADTLEQALDGIIQKTEMERHEIFNKARKEQGLPEQPLEMDSMGEES